MNPAAWPDVLSQPPRGRHGSQLARSNAVTRASYTPLKDRIALRPDRFFPSISS